MQSVELVSPVDNKVLPELGILLQKGTGKEKPADLTAIDTGVQTHSLGELFCLGLALNTPNA